MEFKTKESGEEGKSAAAEHGTEAWATVGAVAAAILDSGGVESTAVERQGVAGSCGGAMEYTCGLALDDSGDEGPLGLFDAGAIEVALESLFGGREDWLEDALLKAFWNQT